ncbi:MAG: dynamin family protein [Candidatus Brocadiae bacterium]|nr:dynamin family protein [Candidatus Brocadiia bacterium]
MSTKNLEEIQELRKQMVEQITIVLSHAKAMDLKGIYDMVSEKMKHIEEDNFYLLVMGEFKRGKSTLINALLGDKILPTKVAPCTGLITEIQYGKEKKAFLYKPKQEKPIEIPPEKIQEYIIIKDSEEEISQTEYEKIILQYPLELCRKNITIVDSPGLNEDNIREDMVKKYLHKIDAAILVLGCDQFLTQTEQEYLERDIMLHFKEHFFVVANRCDDLNEEEQKEIYERAKNNLNTKLPQPWTARFFMVSAKNALQARKNKEKSLWEQKFQEWEKELEKYLISKRAKAKLETPCNIISKEIKKILKEHLPEWESLVNKSSQEIEERLAKAQVPLARLDEIQKEIEQEVEKEKRNFLSKLPRQIETFSYSWAERIEQSEEWNAAVLQNFVWYKMNIKESVTQDIQPVLKRCLQNQIREFLENIQKEAEKSLQELRCKIERRMQEHSKEFQNLKETMYPELQENQYSYSAKDLEIWKDIFGKNLPYAIALVVTATFGTALWIGIAAAVATLGLWKSIKKDSLRSILKQKVLEEFKKKRSEIHSQIEKKLIEEMEKLYNTTKDQISNILRGWRDTEIGKIEKIIYEKKQCELRKEERQKQANRIRKEIIEADSKLEEIYKKI